VGKQPSPRDSGADITIPIAGEHFGAGIPLEQQARAERRQRERDLDDGTPHPLRRASDRAGVAGASAGVAGASTYHLRSRSEQDYPEAYLPVSREMWAELTPAQQEKALRLQAIAMEKVGFEKGAPKFFIDDLDPATGQSSSRPALTANPAASPAAGQASAGAYPATAVLGGVLLGAGAVLLGAALLGQLTPLPIVAGAGGIALITGGVLAATARG
jgi:hypothetical protein